MAQSTVGSRAVIMRARSNYWLAPALISKRPAINSAPQCSAWRKEILKFSKFCGGWVQPDSVEHSEIFGKKALDIDVLCHGVGLVLCVGDQFSLAGVVFSRL